MDYLKTTKEIINEIKKYRNLAIIIKGSPDPDVLASSFALKFICNMNSTKAEIYSLQKISLKENNLLMNKCHIPIRFVKELPAANNFDGYCVLDHQSAYVKEYSNIIPCVLHIDHHERLWDEKVTPNLQYIENEVGSVSTIFSLFLKEIEVPITEEILKQNIATALLYGIFTDTDKYMHSYKIDYEALTYLSNYSNTKILNEIIDKPLSKEIMELIDQALDAHEMHRDWLMAGVGYLPAKKRDHLAIAADFLLQRTKANCVIIFALIEDKEEKKLFLDACFRSKNDDFDLNNMIKTITPNGGARQYKGAFQVKMNYFADIEDHELFWQVVKHATIEKIKNRRENKTLIEIQGHYHKFKSKLRNFNFAEKKERK